MDYQEVLENLPRTTRELTELGVYHPLMYASIARAERRLTHLAATQSAKLEQLGLSPGENGIALDWQALHDSGIYVPAPFREGGAYGGWERLIFKPDEINMFREGSAALPVAKLVLQGPGDGSGEAKLDALRNDTFGWRGMGHAYANQLLDVVALWPQSSIAGHLKQPMNALIDTYRAEMAGEHLRRS